MILIYIYIETILYLKKNTGWEKPKEKGREQGLKTN
jgi:hypothetical protein